MANDELLVARFDAVAVLTLNRPQKRNALSARLMGDLADAIVQLDADAAVRCMILTGTDPAFSAGFDLRNLGNELAATRSLARSDGASQFGLLAQHDTPIIGAINGPAVTGGLELALGCDFLIASERASFADTHGRVGVMPGAGMSIRLPALIGIDRARRMSLTGNFIDAATALSWGLVTEVTAHAQLMERTIAVANSVAQLDPEPVAQLRTMYDEVGALNGPDAWARERRYNREWMTERFSADLLAERANDIMARGSSQN
jgi:enoyl-CoA hydratase